MIVLRKTSFVILLALNGLGTLSHLMIVLTAARASDFSIWMTLLTLSGAATAAGALTGRAGRPGLACLPLALGIPVAMYGIAIAALMIEGRNFH